MREILEGVVERGTGTRAVVPGFRVAGKTGTAQKAVGASGYSKTDFVASFVGFVPSRRPRLTALVILDSPKGDHTGARAAEVFARIAERGLHYLGTVPEMGKEVLPVASHWPSQSPLLPEGSFEGARRAQVSVRPVAYQTPSKGAGVSVPALYGLPARDAVARLVAMELVPKLSGTGRVIDQDPPAGTVVAPGLSCRLILSSRVEALSEVPWEKVEDWEELIALDKTEDVPLVSRGSS
jgi:hypothetical protein